jgi:hypothetical protein
MEGQAREMRGESKDGGGGDKRNKKPNNGDDKIVALALPVIIKVTINHRWWRPVGAVGWGGGWRGG